MYSQLYQLMIKNLYPGKIVRQSLEAMEHTQWLSPGELEAIKLKRIRRLVAHAYEKVPFYRRRYQKEGIHPQDIRTYEDVQAIPYLTP